MRRGTTAPVAGAALSSPSKACVGESELSCFPGYRFPSVSRALPIQTLPEAGLSHAVESLPPSSIGFLLAGPGLPFPSGVGFTPPRGLHLRFEASTFFSSSLGIQGGSARCVVGPDTRGCVGHIAAWRELGDERWPRAENGHIAPHEFALSFRRSTMLPLPSCYDLGKAALMVPGGGRAGGAG